MEEKETLVRKKKKKQMGKAALIGTVAAATAITSMPIGELGVMKAEASSVFAGGSGTAADPYLIENAEQLNAVRNFLSSNFKLTRDIDLSGTNWVPIGNYSSQYKGTFDGNGHTIKNLTINSEIYYVGLFGYALRATIRDLTLENPSIYTSGNTVGAVAGYAERSNIERPIRRLRWRKWC